MKMDKKQNANKYEQGEIVVNRANGYNKRIVKGKVVGKNTVYGSRGGIVSYFDSFIAQKKHLTQYQEAVGKWICDREFVLRYKDPCKGNVEVKSIKGKMMKHYSDK